MTMKPVSGSSQIKAIGHENGTLAVEFVAGGTYHYQDVPASLAETVMNAPSVGSALHEHIKKGGYQHTKV